MAMFRRFLNQLLRDLRDFSPRTRRHRAARRPGPRPFKPTLTALEDRCLLAAGVIQGSVLIDGSAQPVSGATVYLDLNHNGILDAGDLSTGTDANGNYTPSPARAPALTPSPRCPPRA
jgi:hypothetical protein